MRKPKDRCPPKLTDAERYKRFLDAAKELGASDDPRDFERAFNAVVKPSDPANRQTGSKTGLRRIDR
jgi:hypothetical protein